MPPHPIVALPSDLYRTSSISYLFCLKEGVEQKLSWVGTPAPFNHHLHIYEEASSATFLDPARGLTRIYGLRLLIKFYVLPTTKWRILCCYFRLWLVVFWTLRLVVEKAKRQINQVNIVSIYVYMVSLWLLEHDELLVTKSLRKFLFFLRLNKLS